MEKRRRARINHCLNELKSLILEAMKKDPARHTKLEKADILEMTVKHLQSVQRQQLNMAIQTDPTVIHKFKTGFVECAEEVNRYITQLDGVDATVRQRLTSHLKGCASSIEQIDSMTNFNNGYCGQFGAALFAGAALANPRPTAAVNAPAPLFAPLPQDPNNNSNQGAPIQMGGVQLIPSRLPSGEFALIVPNSNAANLLNNNNGAAPALTNAPFAAWPHAAATAAAAAAVSTTTTTAVTVTSNLATQMNDFAANFKRMSAFSKPLTQQQQQQQQQQPSATQVQPTKHSAVAPTISNKTCNGFNTTTAAAFHQPQNNLHHNSTATTSPPLSPISTVSSHGDDSSLMHTSSDFAASSRAATPPQDSADNQNSFSGVFSTPPSSAESSLSLKRTSAHLQQQQVSSTSGSELNAALKRTRDESDDVAVANADSSDSFVEPVAKKLNAEAAENCGSDELLEERDSMWRPW